jgi:tetrahydromethanopterin S-methyltransferase subunit G
MGKIPATKQDVETTVENAVDKLALMINEGFKSTATKDDIKAVTTRLDGIDLRLDTLDGRVDTLDARLGRIEADVHALRDEMVHRQEFHDALDRIKYIEKKLGIESGV